MGRDLLNVHTVGSTIRVEISMGAWQLTVSNVKSVKCQKCQVSNYQRIALEMLLCLDVGRDLLNVHAMATPIRVESSMIGSQFTVSKV